MQQKTVQQYVTKDMTMGDIVQKYPAAIEVMLSNGLHCIGCHVSYWETLEQGTLGHGMTEEQMNKMVDEINIAISESISNTEQGKQLILTKKATDKLKNLISTQKNIGGLKITVSPGGCAGYHYDFELTDSKKDNDMIIETEGVKVFIDQESLDMIKGSTIDYVEALQGAGFKVSNPQATSTCGCGQSFS
ncbi:iron-sulfur cluster assembly accessory protein [Candidatus Woesearchaeota archaeon]|nr:iron-sulfur cluster assembly accessory protein [Candidatus Woesearchaeota archaeon]